MDVSTGQNSINVTSGSHTISAPLALLANTTITVTPSGSILTLSDLQTSTVNLTTAGAGEVLVNNVRASALDISSGSVGVIPGGTSASASVLSSLTIASGAKLDLANNSLIVHGGSLSTVDGLVESELITSSTAAGTNDTALAVVMNSGGSSGTSFTTFEGQSVSSTDVLVKYTYFGDALLTGSVTALDYAQIDNGYNEDQAYLAQNPGGTALPATGWYNGDFNYDGSINGDDYTLIDNAYNSQGSVSLAGVSAGPAEMIASDTAQIATVPEPASLMMVVFGGSALLARRRSR
jgi:hypothetical protein